MTDRSLLRALGAAAVLGGLLRIVSAFVPWTPGSAPLELFYFVVDVLLLFGLMGVYFAHRERLGKFGLFAFVVAETGIASIVGPDAMAFGIDTYAIGVVVITAGLTLLSIQMLAQRIGPRWPPACWIASLLIGSAGSAIGKAQLGFFAGGISFGLGFVGTGLAVYRARW
jgi:hypothetical protein